MILREGLDLIHKFAHVPLRAALQGLLAEQSERAGALRRACAWRRIKESR